MGITLAVHGACRWSLRVELKKAAAAGKCEFGTKQWRLLGIRPAVLGVHICGSVMVILINFHLSNYVDRV